MVGNNIKIFSDASKIEYTRERQKHTHVCTVNIDTTLKMQTFWNICITQFHFQRRIVICSHFPPFKWINFVFHDGLDNWIDFFPTQSINSCLPDINFTKSLPLTADRVMYGGKSYVLIPRRYFTRLNLFSSSWSGPSFIMTLLLSFPNIHCTRYTKNETQNVFYNFEQFEGMT